MTPGRTNPVLNHIDDAYAAFEGNYNYFVEDRDFKTIIADTETVIIDMSKLRLKISDEKFSDEKFAHLIVHTSKKLSEYTHEEQKLLKHTYGPTAKDYSINMKMLNKSEIKKTKIYVLSPKYVRALSAPISRASWLNCFNRDSIFFAINKNVDYNFGVRGVRYSVVEDDAKKNPVEVPAAKFSFKEAL